MLIEAAHKVMIRISSLLSPFIVHPHDDCSCQSELKKKIQSVANHSKVNMCSLLSIPTERHSGDPGGERAKTSVMDLC